MIHSFPKHLQALEPFWGNWLLDEKLGEGGFSQVYRIKREHSGKLYYAALKWIQVVFDDAKIEELKLKGLNTEEITEYFASERKRNEKEIDFMMSLRSHPNIVHIDDYDIIERDAGRGYDILIRMELLTPLTQLLQQGLIINDVRLMGMDICKALSVCAAHQYVHRDIKPANIFINEHGQYKLGDFGIGRNLEQSQSTLSRKAATPEYMSPEMFFNPESVSTFSDQYQLGLVMYQLLSAYRLPFSPITDPILFEGKTQEVAFSKRMNGTKIPSPLQGGEMLKSIIQKACHFDENKRFSSPEAMYKALQDAENEKENREVLLSGKPDAISRLHSSLRDSSKKKKDEKGELDIAFLVKILTIVVLVFALLFWGAASKKNEEKAPEDDLTETASDELSFTELSDSPSTILPTATVALSPTPSPTPTRSPTSIPSPALTSTPETTPFLTPTPIAELEKLTFEKFVDLPIEEGFDTYKGFDSFYYDQGYRFIEGLAWIENENHLFGAINKKGDIVIPFIWQGYLDLGEGYAFVERIEDGQLVKCILDKKGNSLLGEDRSEIECVGAAFNDGLTWARINNEFVILSIEGNVIPLESGYTPVGGFSDRRLLVKSDEGLFGFVNTSGEVAIDCIWLNAYPFSEGFAAVQTGEITEVVEEKKPDVSYTVANWLFIDQQGKQLGSHYFGAVRSYKNGRAAVQNNAYQWGYLNRFGELTLGFRWSRAGDFNNNRAPVGNPELDVDMTGFINGDGQLVTKWQWELFGRFIDGSAPAYSDIYGGMVYINKYGNPLGKKGQTWRCLSNIVNGYGVVSEDGQYFGYVNSGGTLKIPCDWKIAMPFSENLAWVESEKWRGFINEDGKKVIDCSRIGQE